MSLLEVRHLRLKLPIAGEARPILHDVNITVASGEAVALVGESGSGKSMTARAIVRLLPAGAELEGEIVFDGASVRDLSGRDLRLYRANDVGFVFQDPRAHVNPVRTVGDFLVESLVVNRHSSRGEAEKRVLALLDQVGVSRPQERLRQYPHQLSGGLLQRVMIAAALTTEPRLILADEPTTALDVTTQADVMTILEDIRHQSGVGLLLITHDLELAAATCDRTVVMYAGRTLEDRSSGQLHEDPLHPYSAALIRSRPSLTRRADILPAIRGRPLSATEAPPGCPFAPRCDHAQERCRENEAILREVNGGMTACLRIDDLRGTLVPSEGVERG